MKIIAAAVCAFLVTPHAFADHHHEDWMKYYPGEWEYEYKSEDTPSEKGTAKWTLEANGKALVGRFTTENGDVETEVAGWDAVGKAIRVNGFSSNGGSWHIPFTEISETQIGSKTASGVLPNGKKWTGSFFHTREGQNRMTTRVEGRLDGEPFVSTAVWERKAADNSASTMPEDVRKQIDKNMVGAWSYGGSWGDVKFTGEEVTRWVANKTALVTEGFELSDGTKTQYFTVLGWDNDAGKIVHKGFTSIGESWGGEWDETSNTKWSGFGEGMYKGVRWRSPATIEFAKDWQRYEDVTDGKKWVAEFKRKPSSSTLSTMPESIRKQIDSKLIGKWKTTATWGKKKINGSHECRWSVDRSVVISEGYRSYDGKKVTYVEFMGWDGSKKVITKHSHASDGSTTTGAWTEFSDDEWKGYGSGIDDGVPWKSLERFDFSEDGPRYSDEPQDNNPQYVAEFVRED